MQRLAKPSSGDRRGGSIPSLSVSIEALLSKEAVERAWLVSNCGRTQTERIIRVALRAAQELERKKKA